ncbi:TlpA family protein disulfide reductase [Acidihalobacter aeolianus]|uniref:TlpA family protein disulfide reductase n=1 Tax=Acidihalobacter aeolianus TaxID=2792603 RepID=UPI0009F27C5F
MTTSPSPRSRNIKFIISFIVFIALAIFYWSYNQSHPTPSALPDVTLKSLSGHKVSLIQLKGKPIVLNLWATWCPPCRAELPLLVQSSHQHPNIHFYFAEQGNSRANVTTFATHTGLPAKLVLLDQNTRLSKIFGAIGYPTTVFYNAHGQIVTIHRGELTAAKLKQLIDRIVAG